MSSEKKADISLVFKKGNHDDKTNYRPVSILPSLSKIYDRLIFNQITQWQEISKSFDCMTHDLLIAKLHSLNFDMNARNLIFDYLTGKKQRVKFQI